MQGSLSWELLSWNYVRNDLKSKSHITWPNPYLIYSSQREKKVFFSEECKASRDVASLQAQNSLFQRQSKQQLYTDHQLLVGLG